MFDWWIVVNSALAGVSFALMIVCLEERRGGFAVLINLAAFLLNAVAVLMRIAALPKMLA